MQFYGVLVLMVTLSTACGLRCYECGNDKNCMIETCRFPMNRCSTVEVNGEVVSKSCFVSTGCVGPIKCCRGDLCNSAMPTASSVALLLVSSAIITLFL